MPRRKNRLDILRQRAITVEYSLMGLEQEEIAELLGVTQQQVSYDLKKAKQQFLKSQEADMAQIIANELEKLSIYEDEFWEAWQKSKEDRETITQQQGIGGKGEVDVTTTRIEMSPGDPRFLSGILDILKEKRKLRGIDAEIKMAEINAAIAATIKAGFIVTAPNES